MRHPAAQHFVLVALRRERHPQFKSCIQTQASATLARSVLDGSFDDVVIYRSWRSMGRSRCHKPLRQKPGSWSTGWRRLRAHSDADFRDAVTEAAA